MNNPCLYYFTVKETSFMIKYKENRMTKKIVEIEKYSSTPYDDVYRTLVNDCPGLIVPVVNEVFGKAHKETLYVQFPNTAVIYLRHNEKMSQNMSVVINTPGDTCSYQIPVVKVQNYSIDEIFDKKLYFLIPFHIFVYEKSFIEYNENEEKRNELIQLYKNIMTRLEQSVKEGDINEFIRGAIVDMSKKVLEHICANYIQVRKGVKEVMGGQILEYEAKTILREGSNNKLAELITKKLKKGQSLDQIADALEESVETIQKLIKEYKLI